MKKSIIILFTATIAFVLQGCATSSPRSDAFANLEPIDVIRKGSLANQQLIFDASIGATAYLSSEGYRIGRLNPFMPYVLSMPTGAPGEQSWEERWYFDIDHKLVPVNIKFRESGPNAANYMILGMAEPDDAGNGENALEEGRTP